jgi:hypothetical protein
MINPLEVKAHKNKLNKQIEDKYLPILEKHNDAIEEYVDKCLLFDGIIPLFALINEKNLFDTRIPAWNGTAKREDETYDVYDKVREFSRCLANYIKNKYTKVGWLYGEQLNKNNIVTLVTLYV